MELIEAHFLRLRNLEEATLEPAGGLNFIVGPNASGKTSVLEGIYLLGMARSFRTQRLGQAARWGQADWLVSGRLRAQDGRLLRVGVGHGHGETRIRLGGEPVPNRAELAARVPIQYIGSETRGFFDAGPAFRRRQLDWGAFHLEPDFLPAWQRFHRVLKQRNAALRQGADRERLQPWHGQMAEYAEQLDGFRRAAVERLLPILAACLEDLLPGIEVSLSYRPGWNSETSYARLLQANYAQDLRLGYTHAGPQRADLRVTHAGVDAGQSLSRGQKRLFAIAFLIAQAKLLDLCGARRSIVLLDDLQAELDAKRQAMVVRALISLGHQAFVTVTEPHPEAACGDVECIRIDAGRMTKAMRQPSSPSHIES
jgi:DNA replication and repair protein RecF